MVKGMFGYVSFLIVQFSGCDRKTKFMILFHVNQTNAIWWLRGLSKVRQLAYSVAKQYYNINQCNLYFLPAGISLYKIIRW